jgi:hypothetical protein
MKLFLTPQTFNIPVGIPNAESPAVYNNKQQQQFVFGFFLKNEIFCRSPSVEADREGVGARGELGDSWDGPNETEVLFNFYLLSMICKKI